MAPALKLAADRDPSRQARVDCAYNTANRMLPIGAAPRACNVFQLAELPKIPA